ncbi:hypothetical protein [Ruegeria pomeroyi]|uniref:hypothetical protein n=1 Tax=Ruegeria pomeroyi TaxID=89184 RepID=UPI001F23F6F4|nr:hypothetical protein [Ruegeria pomeroyi]
MISRYHSKIIAEFFESVKHDFIFSFLLGVPSDAVDAPPSGDEMNYRPTQTQLSPTAIRWFAQEI